MKISSLFPNTIRPIAPAASAVAASPAPVATAAAATISGTATLTPSQAHHTGRHHTGKAAAAAAAYQQTTDQIAVVDPSLQSPVSSSVGSVLAPAATDDLARPVSSFAA